MTDALAQKVAGATLLYYAQLDGTPPKALELVAWLEKLLPRVQGELFKQGLRYCLTLPAFLRYVLTARGLSLPTFLEGQLEEADFASWLRQENAGGGGARTRTAFRHPSCVLMPVLLGLLIATGG